MIPRLVRLNSEIHAAYRAAKDAGMASLAADLQAMGAQVFALLTRVANERAVTP